MAPKSIYERYGGFSTINRIVIDFYDNVLDSDVIGPFFEDVDLERLIDHQTKFIASLMGGPVSFTDEQLRRAHANMTIAAADFDEMKRILAGALELHGVEAEDVATVMAAIEARRSIIVS